MKPETKFTQRLAALFGEPTSDLGAVVEEYENALAGNPADVLNKAADIIARERTIRAWPTVAECLNAVARAKRLPKGNGTALLHKIDDVDAWWTDRTDGIRSANSEREIQAQLAIIEPYANAGWIASHRLPRAMAMAAERRAQLKSGRGAEFSRRQTGDRE